jgi:hypothetical protein
VTVLRRIHAISLLVDILNRITCFRDDTIYEDICKIWTIEPERFTMNIIHQMTGLNIQKTGFPLAQAKSNKRDAKDHSYGIARIGNQVGCGQYWA